MKLNELKNFNFSKEERNDEEDVKEGNQRHDNDIISRCRTLTSKSPILLYEYALVEGKIVFSYIFLDG